MRTERACLSLLSTGLLPKLAPPPPGRVRNILKAQSSLPRLLLPFLLLSIMAPPVALHHSPVTGQTLPGPAIEVYVVGNVSGEVQAKYRQILVGATGFYQQAFGESGPPVVRLRLYERLTASDWVTFFGGSEERAVRAVQVFSGGGWRENILVNFSRNPLAERVVPHELLHLWQDVWLGSRPRDGWFFEGMAEFYADLFGEQLGIRSKDTVIRMLFEAMKDKRAVVGAILPSVLDGSGDRWATLTGSLGIVRAGGVARSFTYAYALLAYDYLERRSSRSAAVGYIKNRGTGTAHADAFLVAFKISLDEFDSAFKNYLQERIGP